MGIRQFMESRSISDGRSVENNTDKRFQKWVLFNQHIKMRETQTYLLLVQVHLRPVPSPRGGALVGLAPQTKLQAPQIEI